MHVLTGQYEEPLWEAGEWVWSLKFISFEYVTENVQRILYFM